MREYSIDVSRIEDLQTTNNISELEKIFNKAKSTIVNGERVILFRKDQSGAMNKFDEINTLEDLEQYKRGVFKYL